MYEPGRIIFATKAFVFSLNQNSHDSDIDYLCVYGTIPDTLKHASHNAIYNLGFIKSFVI